MSRRLLLNLLALLVVLGAGYALDVAGANAMLAPEQPAQRLMTTPMMFSYKGVKLVAVASYHLRARVLGRKDYQWDPMAKFCPTDLALGWSVMSDPGVTGRMQITQSNRWYYWHTPSFHVSRNQIEENSANVHIVPASPEVQQGLQNVRSGQVVEMKGYLVNAMVPGGMTWKSSMTRQDVGAGSCEIFYVQKLR